MLHYLHTLSAVLFYLLGASFFGAYILAHNNLYGTWPLQWLSIGILPLLLSGILFGSISLYQSLQTGTALSRILLFAIGIPLAFVFLALAVLKFMPVTPIV